MLVTASGSLPGTDFVGALTTMREALPEVLPFPELPARGLGSDLVGRALGLTTGLDFDVQPSGWRLTTAPSRDHRAAAAQWRRDLDDVEEHLQDFEGTLKVAVGGPWTLSACVDRPRGDRILADHGARRELGQALQEGVRVALADLARRLPGARVMLQVDEPLLPSVSGGTVPTASGFSRHRSVPAAEVQESLRLLGSLDERAVLHSCAKGPWLPHALSAGFSCASLDGGLFVSGSGRDELAAWLDGPRGVILGVVDTAVQQVQPVDVLVSRALDILRPLDLDPATLADHVVLGTACGLAGWSVRDVVPQIRALREAAPLVAERLTR